MPIEAYWGIGIAIVLAIGFIQLCGRLITLTDTVSFLSEYRDKYAQFAREFTDTGRVNAELYHWLTLHVVRAQSDLGALGIGHYTAPFGMYSVNNYPIIINTIPKFRGDPLQDHEIRNVDDVLIRSIGYYNRVVKNIRKDIRNPVKYFQRGMGYIISLPFRLLSWFGIISDNSIDKITGSQFFIVMSGIISLISFISSVITICIGWEQFSEIINNVFKSI